MVEPVRKLLALGDKYVDISYNGGVNWKHVRNPPTLDRFYTDAAKDPQSSRWALVSYGEIDGFAPNVWTSDNGEDWTLQYTFPGAGYFFSIAHDSREFFYIGGWDTLGDGFILRSPDGVNWTTIASFLPGAVYGIDADGRGNVIAVGQSGYVYVSNDNGESFAPSVEMPSSAFHIKYVRAEDTWLTGTGGGRFVHSLDSGASWVTNSIGLYGLRAFAYQEDTGLFIASSVYSSNTYLHWADSSFVWSTSPPIGPFSSSPWGLDAAGSRVVLAAFDNLNPKTTRFYTDDVTSGIPQTAVTQISGDGRGYRMQFDTTDYAASSFDLDMSVNIVQGPKGHAIPELEFVGSKEQAFKKFKKNLTEAVTKAQDGFEDAKGAVDKAVEAMNTALGTVDGILAQNQDPNTPSSTSELLSSIGGMKLDSEVEDLEKRMAEIFDLNVTNGLLLTKGDVNLGSLRRMFQLLDLNLEECSLPDLTGKNFKVILSKQETVETIVGESCGQPIVEFSVVETKIGEDISLARASELTNTPIDDILIRFFWYGEVDTGRATQARIQALGIEDDDLVAVMTAPQETSRVYSNIIDTSAYEELTAKMSAEDLCRLLTRPDTNSGVSTDSTDTDVIREVRGVINSNTSSVSNRNKAGTSERAITPNTPTTGSGSPQGIQEGDGGSVVQPASNNVAPAGRAADPALLLAACVDIPKTLGVSESSTGAVQDALDALLGTSDEPSSECYDLLEFADISISALEALAAGAKDFFAEMYGALGPGALGLDAGVGFATCLGSANIGAGVGLELGLKLPFDMQVFLEVFSGAVDAIVSAIGLVKDAMCLPQAALNLLFGGICGFKPFAFGACPPDLEELIDRVRNLINLATGLLTSLLSALQIMKVDVSAAVKASVQLSSDLGCIAQVTPLAISLSL